MKNYRNFTPHGLYFQLSQSQQGVVCILIYDVLDCELKIRFFTDKNRALRYINNL